MDAIRRLRLHPHGFWFVFWGEMAERASFYGMRTLLAFYVVDALGFGTASAASLIQFFLAGCYLAPLLGGWIADRWLGRYRTILYFALPYISGHLILGGFQTRWALFTALVLLALGSGAIKPNTTTLMGMMYEAEKKTALMSEAFTWFYAAVNIGSVISTFVLPLVRAEWGWGPALTIPAGLMAVSFGLFALGKRHYPKEEIRSAPPPKSSTQRAAERETLKRIAGIFATVAVFWFVFDQFASTWMYFARDHMNLTVLPGLRLMPAQLQMFDPFLVVALTPFFNWMWKAWRARRGGREIADTSKMRLGFCIAVACTGLMSLAGYLSRFGKVSVWWELGAILVLTLSELCVSVVGLELAYKVALPGTKSLVTAAFLSTTFVGDFFGGFFDRLYDRMSPGDYFALQTAIILAATFAFMRFAQGYDRTEARTEPRDEAAPVIESR